MEDQASEQVMNFIPGPHSLSAQRAHEHHRLFAGRGPQVLHFRQKNALPRQPSGAEVGKPVGLENEERSTGGGEEAAASPPPGDSPPRGTRFAARRRARFVRPPIPATSLAPRAGPRDARPPLTLPTAPARAPGPGTTTPHRSPRSALRAPGPESPAPPPPHSPAPAAACRWVPPSCRNPSQKVAHLPCRLPPAPSSRGAV